VLEVQTIHSPQTKDMKLNGRLIIPQTKDKHPNRILARIYGQVGASSIADNLLYPGPQDERGHAFSESL
jgi:hypothetical protein